LQGKRKSCYEREKVTSHESPGGGTSLGAGLAVAVV